MKSRLDRSRASECDKLHGNPASGRCPNSEYRAAQSAGGGSVRSTRQYRRTDTGPSRLPRGFEFQALGERTKLGFQRGNAVFEIVDLLPFGIREIAVFQQALCFAA